MRRMCAVALAALLGLGAGAWPADASDNGDADVSVVRLGGADRYATSLLVAEQIAADAGGSLTSAVLVSGERWTDGAVAASMAGALGAPVLLNPPDELNADVLGFLRRASVSDVMVIGADSSDSDQGHSQGLSAAVVDALKDTGISVERVADSNPYRKSDPYRISIAMARRVDPGVMGSLGRTAIVASDQSPAGALVAGPIAARGIHPVLLTPRDRLHGGVAAYLAEAQIEHVIVMDGTGALSDSVESTIAAAGMSVTRLAGSTIYDLAAQTADFVSSHHRDAGAAPCFTTATIGLARAEVPFDAISAAPLLARRCVPLALADHERIPADAAALLDTARTAHDTLTLQVFGGEAAISEAAIDTYLGGDDPIAACRPRGADASTAEFPRPELAVPSTGKLRVAVLFMDFPNVKAPYSTHEEAERSLPFMEQYLEAVSYGTLDIEVKPLHKWLRAPERYGHYVRTTRFGDQLGRLASRQAVELADPEFDFSDTDAVLTVFPSWYFRVSGSNGLVSADGATMTMTAVNIRRDFTLRGQEAWLRSVLTEWGMMAAHQLAHGFGLPDLFPFEGDFHARAGAPDGMEWITAEFGAMYLESHFLEHEWEMLLRRPIRLLSGEDAQLRWHALVANEMLAWHRWQLGWLDASQVRCLSGTDAKVTLAPIAQPGGRVAMAVVPLNDHEVIVVESRRKLGYDVDESFAGPQGETISFPALLEEGLLVYTVDMLAPSGRLPIRIAGDQGCREWDDYPILGVGESVTVRGHTITLTADSGGAHTVAIAPADPSARDLTRSLAECQALAQTRASAA